MPDNSLWRTQLARTVAHEFAKDRGDIPIEHTKSAAWLRGWTEAFTHAYIVFCSVLESRQYDGTHLAKWLPAAETSRIPDGTPLVKRWRSRETGDYSYAVTSKRVTDWSDDSAEYMRLD